MRKLTLTLLTITICAFGVSAQETIPMSDCAMCHEDVAEVFGASSHGQAIASHSSAMLEVSCATCHEATADHIDDPTPDNVRRVPSSNACRSCHTGALAKLGMTSSAHARTSVECSDCHAADHGEHDADHLLIQPSHKLCASCHLTEAAAFKMPFAHRDGTRAFACINCHSIHGDTDEGRLHRLGNGGACISCHSEKAGPFVFPHPPREHDGCVTCHVPHGSPNPRQLKRRDIRSLCLECHADVPAFHDVSRPRYQKCQTCHTAVHGSNRDPRLIEE
ncbi:MAG: hypothetical protein GY906_13265 [bacterium]|nr:hypothetical protein [bacterium]